MMPGVFALFPRTLKFFLSNPTISLYSVIAICICGLEQVFQTLFKCPCEQLDAKTYAIFFLATPPVVLFVLGIMANSLMWQVFQGCCDRKHPTEGMCYNTFKVLLQALFLPTVWLFVTLIDGDYYACMESTDPCMKQYDEYKCFSSKSQVYGFFFLVIMLSVAGFVISYNRFFSNRTYVEHQYAGMYKKIEDEIMLNEFKKKAGTIAKENAEYIDKIITLKKEDWDLVGALEPVDLSSALSTNEELILPEREKEIARSFISPLQMWAACKRT